VTDSKTGTHAFVGRGGSISINLGNPGGISSAKGNDPDEDGVDLSDVAETQKDVSQTIKEANLEVNAAHNQVSKEIKKALAQLNSAKKDIKSSKQSESLDESTRQMLRGVESLTSKAIQDGIAKANAEMKKEGINIDLTSLTKEGLDQARKGIDAATLAVKCPIVVPLSVASHSAIQKSGATRTTGSNKAHPNKADKPPKSKLKLSN